jgi:orotidine-5'-phosphate decarboxylase
MKVGMQLYYAEGPRIVAMLKEAGYRVFLDLKLHDIPNTVKGAARSITALGTDMFNVHAAGGRRMMAAALEGAEEAVLSGAAGGRRDGRPLIIAVTHLTSTDRETLNGEIGIPGTMEEAVLKYAELAGAAGLDGVVASPLEVAAIKRRCGEAFLAVTPGIRPAGSEAGDQARIAAPREALAAGADYLVIGRPVTRASDPRGALERIIEELMNIG